MKQSTCSPAGAGVNRARNAAIRSGGKKSRGRFATAAAGCAESRVRNPDAVQAVPSDCFARTLSSHPPHEISPFSPLAGCDQRAAPPRARISLWSRARLLAGFALAANGFGLRAADAVTSTITGRVFNQATARYVNNARIAIKGTTKQTFTDQGGTYIFHGREVDPSRGRPLPVDDRHAAFQRPHAHARRAQRRHGRIYQPVRGVARRGQSYEGRRPYRQMAQSPVAARGWRQRRPPILEFTDTENGFFASVTDLEARTASITGVTVNFEPKCAFENSSCSQQVSERKDF